jgi:hypothetical protein
MMGGKEKETEVNCFEKANSSTLYSKNTMLKINLHWEEKIRT